MSFNLQIPEFSHAEVLEATGLDSSTLQNWTARRFVTAASEDLGRNYGRNSKLRAYSGEDVVWLALLAKMVETFRIPIGQAVNELPFSEVRDGLRQGGGSLPYLAVIRVPLRFGDCFIAKVETIEELTKGVASHTEAGNIQLIIPTRQTEQKTIAKLKAILGRR